MFSVIFWVSYFDLIATQARIHIIGATIRRRDVSSTVSNSVRVLFLFNPALTPALALSHSATIAPKL